MSKMKRISKHQHRPFGRQRSCIQIFGITIPLPSEINILEANGISAKLKKALAMHDGRKILQEQMPTGSGDQWKKFVATIATNAWRAERRILDPDTNEPKGDMKLLYRDINAIRKALEQMRVETIDPTDRVYDSGMALKVISFEPTPGFSKEQIKETIKPSVTWQDCLIQMGEVIVGTPQTTKDQKWE